MRQMPQRLRVFSRPWQIQAMGEDHEGVCIDCGSGLETPLAVPLLRANDEHRAAGCAASHSSLHPGHCRFAVVLSGWGKGDPQCLALRTGACRRRQNPGPLSEAGKSPLSEDPTSDPGGTDRAKRTQAMGRMLSKRAFSACKSLSSDIGSPPQRPSCGGLFRCSFKAHRPFRLLPVSSWPGQEKKQNRDRLHS